MLKNDCTREAGSEARIRSEVNRLVAWLQWLEENALQNLPGGHRGCLASAHCDVRQEELPARTNRFARETSIDRQRFSLCRLGILFAFVQIMLSCWIPSQLSHAGSTPSPRLSLSDLKESRAGTTHRPLHLLMTFRRRCSRSNRCSALHYFAFAVAGGSLRVDDHPEQTFDVPYVGHSVPSEHTVASCQASSGQAVAAT